jgi:H+/Cl- antiporter ClcA
MSESNSAASGPPDPRALLRDRSYVALLVLGGAVGVPVAAIAYFFLKAIAEAQHFLYTTLPGDLGFSTPPRWWPLPLLAVGGVVVAFAIRSLPGTGGHKPAEGFKSSPTLPVELPGVFLAAAGTLACGAVLGPEAPLIAIGGGLGALAVHLLKRDAPQQAVTVIGVAGSFAAISTLLGSPIVGAFLLMEVSGLAGPMLGVVLVPGLLAAGVGALIFVGLDNWTGFGTFSLAVPDIPALGQPTVAEFLWAIVIGIAAAVLGTVIKRSALYIQPVVERRMLLLTPVLGLAVGAAAILFDEVSDKGIEYVLFSGQDQLGPLIQAGGTWSVGTVVLLVLCKAAAYAVSLSGFRGGPIFPGMFIGAAGGIALSALPGLPLIAGVGMGIGAMTVAMLGLPLTSVLLTALFLQGDGLALTPLVIVAVTVSYVASARLAPEPDGGAGSPAASHAVAATGAAARS